MLKGARLQSVLSPAVAVLSMLPGFIMPFVLTATMGHGASDPFFLAVSVSLVLTNILGNTIELNTVVQIGRVRAVTGKVSRRAVRMYRRKVRKFAFSAILLGGSVLIAGYYFAAPAAQRDSFLLIALITLAVPLIGSEASSRSGQLIACGRQKVAIMMQAARSVMPLLLLVVFPSVSVFVVAGSVVVGELLRYGILNWLAKKEETQDQGPESILQNRGLVTQSISSSAVQLAPVADRMFLSGAPSGSLTSYELADKIFYAGAQFLNLGYLVVRVRRWSELRSVTRLEGIQILRSDLKALTSLSVGSTFLALAVLYYAPELFPFPDEWRQGLDWSKWIVLSLPVTIVSMACSRLLVVADRQNLLLWFASGIAVGTVVTDWLLYGYLGAVGIPIAAVAIRTISALIYVVVTWRCLVPVLGSDLPGLEPTRHVLENKFE